jgi:site-specific DNA recombinase
LTRRARRQANDAHTKLDRFLAALEAGIDPALIAERTRATQAELAEARSVIDAYESSFLRPVTSQEIYDLLEEVSGLASLLAEADTEDRRHVYQAAGVNLRYQRTENGEKITASLRVGFSRVGEGT